MKIKEKKKVNILYVYGFVVDSYRSAIPTHRSYTTQHPKHEKYESSTK